MNQDLLAIEKEIHRLEILRKELLKNESASAVEKAVAGNKDQFVVSGWGYKFIDDYRDVTRKLSDNGFFCPTINLYKTEHCVVPVKFLVGVE